MRCCRSADTCSATREDGEDALQQTFLRAHRALEAGQLPDTVRPWLFAIARNRCKTMLAARREACVSVDDVEPSIDGLGDDVAARADLRELVADLGRLPEDQRAALVLFELGGMSQAEIAGSIGVPAGKVKALVFQARTELMAERDARSAPCDTIREELAVARGGALRRGPLRRHLKHCEPCQAYRFAIAGQRAGLAAIMPVAPALGLKAAVLAAAVGKGAFDALAARGAAGGGAPGRGAASARRRRRGRERRRGERRGSRRRPDGGAASGAAAAGTAARRCGSRRRGRNGRRGEWRRGSRRRGRSQRGGGERHRGVRLARRPAAARRRRVARRPAAARRRSAARRQPAAQRPPAVRQPAAAQRPPAARQLPAAQRCRRWRRGQRRHPRRRRCAPAAALWPAAARPR